MAVFRRTQTSDLEGGGNGLAFNDGPIIPNLKTAVITQIVVTADSNHFRSITVHYADFAAPVHGQPGSGRSELILGSGEFINHVEGRIDSSVISKIKFATNKGRSFEPIGQAKFTPSFTWGGFGAGMGLLYISGRADTHIRMLQATFGMYFDLAKRPPRVLYERHAITAPAQLSVFAQNLMSPTVTLLIGPDNIQFNASQHILCRLSFFRAALEGQFREASEKKLTMPEDDPQNVSAVIEFLYTGNYTYQYRTDEKSAPSPAPDLTEGLYHVGVYATAHKYGCEMLEEAALRSFVYVLGHLKGVEVLRLWKGAYAENLCLGDVEGDGKLDEFKRGLPELLKELYTRERAEVEATAAEYPLLVSDLLRLLVI